MAQHYLISEDAAWYVKTGLDRAIRNTRQFIDNAHKRIEKLETSADLDDEFKHEFIAETRVILEYHEQWLSEALAAYQLLPQGLVPPAAKE